MPEVLVFSSPEIIKIYISFRTFFYGVQAIPNFLQWNQFSSNTEFVGFIQRLVLSLLF